MGQMDDNKRAVLGVVVERYLEEMVGSTVKEIAAKLGWSESKVRRVVDDRSGVDGLTSAEEGRSSYSTAYRMMEAGVHKVRVYYPTRQKLAALVNELRLAARIRTAEAKVDLEAKS
jgi:predicted transcriptional regulator